MVLDIVPLNLPIVVLVVTSVPVPLVLVALIALLVLCAVVEAVVVRLIAEDVAVATFAGRFVEACEPAAGPDHPWPFAGFRYQLMLASCRQSPTKTVV